MRGLKRPRKERKKPVRVQYLPRPDKKSTKEDDPYAFLDNLVRAHHRHLSQAKIAIAWMLDVKPDRDFHLILGRCKKATDLDREFREFDLVILLNAKAWKELTAKQRAALVDHELCHAALVVDKNNEPVFDERDRQCYRIRRHDIEEFNAVVKRHGCYLSDVAEFVRQATNNPLLHAMEKGDQNREK
jgi:hypothetical protein